MDGYKILDFKGVTIEGSPTVEGLYKAIDESNKPFIITNVKTSVSPYIEIKPYYVGFVAKIRTGADSYGYILPTPIIADGVQINMIVNEDDSITYNG